MLKEGEMMEITFVFNDGRIKKNTNTRFCGIEHLMDILPSIIYSYDGFKHFIIKGVCVCHRKQGFLIVDEECKIGNDAVDIIFKYWNGVNKITSAKIDWNNYDFTLIAQN